MVIVLGQVVAISRASNGEEEHRKQRQVESWYLPVTLPTDNHPIALIPASVSSSFKTIQSNMRQTGKEVRGNMDLSLIPNVLTHFFTWLMLQMYT